jgi:N-acetylglucosamine kinase-like BadF-type ATPase
MILIADSGSTKSDWVLTNGGDEVTQFNTKGFNPFFHDEKFILEHLSKVNQLNGKLDKIKQVFFYGAGCSSKEMNAIIESALSKLFISANINIDHDLMACALSTYDGKPGISCILGTGSNSCFYDGDQLNEEVPALGYILGDEGSGSYYGKKLLTDYLYKRLPEDIHLDLEKTFNISKSDIFENVYMKPDANTYLASYMKFISTHKSSEYIDNMITNGMKHFMQVHVCCYKKYLEVPCHFIGSVSFHFKEQLFKAAKELNISIGNVIKKPIDGLVDYHIKQGLD